MKKLSIPQDRLPWLEALFWLALAAGSLLLIERGEAHEIRNTGRTPLKTVNFYSPPAYTRDGDERPAGRPPRRR